MSHTLGVINKRKHEIFAFHWFIADAQRTFYKCYKIQKQI